MTKLVKRPQELQKQKRNQWYKVLLFLVIIPFLFPRAVLAQTKPMYAYYYLWWSNLHWHDKLGVNYPYSASPLPLPATLGANGCSPVTRYSGNQLIDVSNPSLYIQDNPGVIEADVRNAYNAGLRGFLVNWAGTGDPNQTVNGISYSRRLDAMFTAVTKLRSEGKDFRIIISYKASAVILSDSYIHGDLAYLVSKYGNHPSYDYSYSTRPLLLWEGSRKYALSTIQYISNVYRSRFFLLGDETYNTWDNDNRIDYLDGIAYYWSSQNPYDNTASFSHLQTMAQNIRNSGQNPDGTNKLWVSPLAPGYNSLLLDGGTCTPRIGVCPLDPAITDTLQCLYKGNSLSKPDLWSVISWNEIAEGTYIMPLTRWGDTYLNKVKSLIGNGWITDYVNWKKYYSTTPVNGAAQGDFNADSKVNGRDYMIWVLSGHMSPSGQF